MKTISIFGVLLSIMLIVVHVDPASLSLDNQDWCKSNGRWVFGIGGIVEQDAPPTIEVTWSNNESISQIIFLTRYYNSFAFYETTDHLELTVADAIAKLPESWTGKFSLICNHPTGVKLVSFTANSTSFVDKYGAALLLMVILIILILWKAY